MLYLEYEYKGCIYMTFQTQIFHIFSNINSSKVLRREKHIIIATPPDLEDGTFLKEGPVNISYILSPHTRTRTSSSCSWQMEALCLFSVFPDVTSPWRRLWVCLWAELPLAPQEPGKRKPWRTWAGVWGNTSSSSTARIRWTSEVLGGSSKVCLGH